MKPGGPPFTPGTKLADRITMLGYSLNQVARGAHVNRWHLNDYLNRRRTIIPVHLQRLCAFLHCEPEAIYEHLP